jgi:hypothetical protein
VFVVDCRKYGFIQEEAKSIFNQRRQNGWGKKSIYTLKSFPQHMKQITKCYALQTYVVVENIENLDAEWCPLILCVCVCVCMSVCVCVCMSVCGWVMSLAGSLLVCSGGLVVRLYGKHAAEPLERN